MALLRAAVANPLIARLLGAWAATALATWAFTILLALYAYRRGGAEAVGVAVLVRVVPAAVLATWIAAAVDRRSRRAALIASALVRAAAMAALAGAVAVTAALPWVLALAAVFTVAADAHKPAQAALLPQVARHPTELAAANVAWSSVDAAAFLAGSLLAGVLAATAGLAVAFGACVVPLLAAALVARSLPADSRPPAVPGAASEGRIRELTGGLRTVVKHPELRLVFGVFGANQLVQGMIDVLLVLAAIELLGLGEPGAGWLNGAWGVGGLAGGLAAVELLRRGRLAFGLAVGCLLAGLPLCLIALVPVTGAALAAMVVLGVGFALLEVAVLTLIQRLAADDVLARVFGVELLLHLLGTGLGSVLAVVLVSVTGVAPALAITGALLPLLALLCRRRFAAVRLGATVSEDVFALVRSLAIFAPLPVATVETLALRMRPEDRRAGSVVITQGQSGEDFYVVADGEVEVSIDGRAVRTLGAGSFFGEISLLRDVPRTATVRALGDVRLLRLEREAFLAGIRAHPRSGHAAEGVVLERLAAAPAREPEQPVAR